MERLVPVALLILSLPSGALGNPPSADHGEGRSFHLPRHSDHQRFSTDDRIGRTEVAPNAHFGFGMFGTKTERGSLQPVTAREIDAPKQRRAAVGFSLKF
jgi:hypothetical protein